MSTKPKLTPGLHEDIVRAIAVGAQARHAAQYAGISYKTFLRWMARGKQNKDGEHSRFYRAVGKTRSAIICKSNEVIRGALDSLDHHAALSLLKILLKDDYEEDIDEYLAGKGSSEEDDASC